VINSSLWSIIGAANIVAPIYSKYYHFCHFYPLVAPIIGATSKLPPVGKETLTACIILKISRIYLCLQHHYIDARWLAAQRH
jgi:hypothetical protein